MARRYRPSAEDVPSLADGPFGPWEQLEEGGEPVSQGPLVKSGLQYLADTYEALQLLRGISPREADELEIWEVAVLLGVGKEEKKEDGSPSSPGRYDHLHKRLRHSRGEGPKPEPEPMDPQTLRALTEAFQP